MDNTFKFGCFHCGSTGWYLEDGYHKTCPKCEGKGYREIPKTKGGSKMTIAEKISELLGDDGQNWTTYEGELFHDLVSRYQGKEEWRDGYRVGDVVKVTFPDGSIITVAGDAWDFGHEDCWCWASFPHRDECEKRR